jgi:glycosyltransferase involved in cell wall biosynthesis
VTGQRVALVLASSTGGIGRHVASIAGGLVEHGYEVSVHGPAATGELFGFAELGAAFEPVEIPATPQLGDAGAVRTLRRQLRGRPPVAVVHAHGLRAGVVAALARPAGAGLVVTWHNLLATGGLRGPLYRRLEGYVARSADVTLGASEDLVAHARELGARDARLAAVAAPALPPPEREPAAVRTELEIEPDRPLVVSVGRLHPQKGYEVLVDAAARWCERRPEPVVLVAGSGPSYMRLAARISAAHAPVTLLGHRTDVAELLGAADLAVVTSVWEARQLFAQEALVAGVPLVATAVGGIPDLVGDAALLVEPGDVDAFDAAVQRMLDDPELRREYAERGRARAAAWPTEADTLAQLEAVYAALPAPGQD